MIAEGIKKIYSLTIDRSKFREVFTRYVVFILPLFYIGREAWWPGAIVLALAVLIRAWAAGCLYKDESVAGGPYVLVRHPLYLGSILLAVGMILLLHHWFVTLFIGGITFLQYWHTIRHEEQNLIKRFGDSYRNYMTTAGPLWPKPKGLWLYLSGQRKRFGFSFKQYMKNREYECMLGVLALIVLIWAGENADMVRNFLKF